MSLLSAKEQNVICPYDVSHMVPESRLQNHLVRCEYAYRTRHPNAKISVCPFNSTHKFLELSLKCHVNYLCPDRKKVDTFVCKTEEDLKPAVELKNITVEAEISENWDDANDPTYNPEDHILDKPLLLLKQCAPPLERKLFRMQERKRHQELEYTIREVDENVQTENTKATIPPLRLPRFSSRVANVGEVAMPIVTQMRALSFNTDNKPSSFTMPKCGKGRGRGRILDMK